jgi:hypothetical protein
MTQVLVQKVKTVGKLKDAGRVVLTLEIRYNDREGMSVDHQPLNGYKELSICGDIYYKNGLGMCGQIDGTLRKSEWRELNVSKEELDEILAIWDEWHLNDLNAGCCHQDRVMNNQGYDEWKKAAAIETAKCPHGYAYGSKWLVRVLPEDVEKRIIELFS